MPERVLKALSESKSFEEFRSSRPFRYLHMFSREKDQLGTLIKEEAKKARLQVYVESLDRKKDSDLNLASNLIYDEIEKSVTNGEWDGYHSGFPCASFSRVRWRDSPGGAAPVRSAAHIYGLPGTARPSKRRPMKEPSWLRGPGGCTRSKSSRSEGEQFQKPPLRRISRQSFQTLRAPAWSSIHVHTR